MSKLSKASKEVKKIIHPPYIRSIIRAGAANSGPPFGPMLGQRGLPIAKFVADFNNLTKDIKPGTPIPTRIHVDGKKFSIQLFEPAASFLIRQAAGIKKGKRPGEHPVGKVTYKHVYEIASVKLQQENVKIRSTTLQEMCQMVAHQCHTVGVEVVRDLDPDEYDEFLTEREALEEKYQQDKEQKLLDAKKKLAKKMQKQL